jgi:hypothetical protein
MSHETLPLELLGLVNKGNPRISDNQVRLRRMPINTSTTFGDWPMIGHLLPTRVYVLKMTDLLSISVSVLCLT